MKAAIPPQTNKQMNLKPSAMRTQYQSPKPDSRNEELSIHTVHLRFVRKYFHFHVNAMVIIVGLLGWTPGAHQ